MLRLLCVCALNAVRGHLPFRRLSSWVIGGLKEAASSDPLETSGSLVISQETGFNIYSVEFFFSYYKSDFYYVIGGWDQGVWPHY